MKNKSAVVSLLAIIAHPVAASAQSPDTASLSVMVISASRTPVAKSSLTQPVTIISGEELKAKGITRVVDALRTVPGVALVENGSTGSVSTLFLRGGESRYTKILVDGVPVNAPGGFFDFSHLSTDNIERIEVVRGPASVVYGADAVSGIVQIFTRQGRGPANGSIEARAGNLASRELTLDANGESGKSRYSIGGGMRRSDGNLPFNNNYYNGTLSGSFGYNSAPGSDMLVTVRYGAAEFHYPTDFTGAPVDSNAYRVQHRLTVGLENKAKISERTTAHLRLGTNEVSDLTEDIVADAHSQLESRNKRRSADVTLTRSLPAQATMSYGIAYERESEHSVNSEGPVGGAASPTSSFDAARSNLALYSEIVRATPSGGSMTIAMRRDDNSDYDAFTTWRAGFNLPAGTSSRIRASFNTAFNAPAFNQVRPTLYTVASPDLRPERATSWEIGLEQTLVYGIVKASASYFNQRFRDLIQYVSGGPPDYLGSYSNLAEAQSNGYEIELTLTPVNGWSASAGYTVAKPHVTRVSSGYSGDLREGDALLRRPTHSGTASVSWTRAAVTSVSLIGSFAGSRPDQDFTKFPSPTVTLPAYGKVDLSASQALWHSSSARSKLSATLRISNILDRRYEEVLNFPAARRTWLIGARYEGAM